MLEIIASHLDGVAAVAGTWGLLLVFVFMAVESSFIPFPSEVVMVPAGFLAARGELLASFSPWGALGLAIVAGTAGSLAGAYVNYYLSLWVGKPFLEKYGKWFFVKKDHLDRACEVFNRYGAATTFVCRLVPVVRQLISIPAGISRMPLIPFSVFTGVGAGIWTAILAVIGYAIGRSAGDVSYLELCVRGKDLASQHAVPAIAAAVLIAAFYMLASKAVMRRTMR